MDCVQKKWRSGDEAKHVGGGSQCQCGESFVGGPSSMEVPWNLVEVEGFQYANHAKMRLFRASEPHVSPQKSSRELSNMERMREEI
jgi:hypothetical protein